MSLCPLSTDFYKFKCEKFSCSSENCFNWHGCCVCGGSELISTQILCLFFIPIVFVLSLYHMFQQESGHGTMRVHYNSNAMMGFILIRILKTDLTERNV